MKEIVLQPDTDHTNEKVDLDLVGVRDGTVRDYSGTMDIECADGIFIISSARIPETKTDELHSVIQESGYVNLDIDDTTTSVVLEVRRVSGQTNITCGDRTIVFIGPHSGNNKMEGFTQRHISTKGGKVYTALLPDGRSADDYDRWAAVIIKVDQTSGWVNVKKTKAAILPNAGKRSRTTPGQKALESKASGWLKKIF